jgi:hypothetical protein
MGVLKYVGSAANAGQQQQLQQEAMLMQRVLSSGMAGPSGQDHQALVNNNMQPGMYAGQLHGRPLGTMSHGQALVPSHGQALQPSGSQGYMGISAEVESILKDAHEAYRNGEFTQALQLCHAVRTHLPSSLGRRCILMSVTGEQCGFSFIQQCVVTTCL